jgi:hypothetical protein
LWVREFGFFSFFLDLLNMFENIKMNFDWLKNIRVCIEDIDKNEEE